MSTQRIDRETEIAGPPARRPALPRMGHRLEADLGGACRLGCRAVLGPWSTGVVSGREGPVCVLGVPVSRLVPDVAPGQRCGWQTALHGTGRPPDGHGATPGRRRPGKGPTCPAPPNEPLHAIRQTALGTTRPRFVPFYQAQCPTTDGRQHPPPLSVVELFFLV